MALVEAENGPITDGKKTCVTRWQGCDEEEGADPLKATCWTYAQTAEAGAEAEDWDPRRCVKDTDYWSSYDLEDDELTSGILTWAGEDGTGSWSEDIDCTVTEEEVEETEDDEDEEEAAASTTAAFATLAVVAAIIA